jgi:hypothetical protein
VSSQVDNSPRGLSAGFISGIISAVAATVIAAAIVGVFGLLWSLNGSVIQISGTISNHTEKLDWLSSTIKSFATRLDGDEAKIVGAQLPSPPSHGDEAKKLSRPGSQIR